MFPVIYVKLRERDRAIDIGQFMYCMYVNIDSVLQLTYNFPYGLQFLYFPLEHVQKKVCRVMWSQVQR